jgi:predicted transcriptional regulator
MNTRTTNDTRRRRDKLVIMAEILEITRIGALKTQIMYKANLSFTQLTEYLGLLLQLGFIEKTAVKGKDKKVYLATQKGKDFLQRQQTIMGLVNDASVFGNGVKLTFTPKRSITSDRS